MFNLPQLNNIHDIARTDAIAVCPGIYPQNVQCEYMVCYAYNNLQFKLLR